MLLLICKSWVRIPQGVYCFPLILFYSWNYFSLNNGTKICWLQNTFAGFFSRVAYISLTTSVTIRGKYAVWMTNPLCKWNFVETVLTIYFVRKRTANTNEYGQTLTRDIQHSKPRNKRESDLYSEITDSVSILRGNGICCETLYLSIDHLCSNRQYFHVKWWSLHLN